MSSGLRGEVSALSQALEEVRGSSSQEKTQFEQRIDRLEADIKTA